MAGPNAARPPVDRNFVYTFRLPLELGRGTTALTADVGAVPEPATMLLVGTGLAGAASPAFARFCVTGPAR